MRRLRQRLRAAIGRFTGDERATTIVEFALLATPFFMLIFGIFELGLIFLVSTTLENAITASGRQIRTGEAQTAGMTAAQFKTSICNNMTWLGSSCATNLNIDVRTYTNFSGITNPAPPVVNGAVNPAALMWSTGGSGDIVVVRAYYTWGVITPLLNPTMVNLGNNKRLISATVAFRNEPYDP